MTLTFELGLRSVKVKQHA